MQELQRRNLVPTKMWERQMLRSIAIIQPRVIETLRLISGALSPVQWIREPK